MYNLNKPYYQSKKIKFLDINNVDKGSKSYFISIN